MCVSVRGRPGKQIPDPLFGYIEMKNLLLRSNAFLKYVRYLDGTFRKRVTVALAMTASNVRLIYAVCHQRLVIHFPCDHLRHIGVCFESRTVSDVSRGPRQPQLRTIYPSDNSADLTNVGGSHLRILFSRPAPIRKVCQCALLM